MKKGFYRSTRVEVEDNQGGVTYRIESYYYIGYIDKNKLFFILGQGSGFPNWPLFVKQYEGLNVKGELVSEQNDQIEISFYNSYLDTKKIFTGRSQEDKLYLKGYQEDKPDEIWLEDVFEYIGTGEGQI